jgi:4-hydroxy-tetrahydrodipicolinate reductase
MVKLGISGIAGRMGQRILSLAHKSSTVGVVAGLEEKTHPTIGKKIEGVAVYSDPDSISQCDCLIEFSTPLATLEHLPFLLKHHTPCVIGTTGLNKDDVSKIQEVAEKVAVVFSPNMSIGVNLLFSLVEAAARVLGNYNISLEEAHHIHKKDAPSGTAKKIAEILNTQGFSIKIEDILARRENEIVGDHKVVFSSDMDTIELFHSAKTRDIFAQGALLAAQWVVNKSSGLYSMRDVLFDS